MQTCVECRNLFSADDMIRHGDTYVCADCKPIFMQKLVEGAIIDPSALRYARFWVRFWAFLVDRLIVGTPLVVIALIVIFSTTDLGSRSNFYIHVSFTSFWMVIGVFCAATVYETLMVGKYGATLGKMIWQLKVVTAQNDPVSYRRALGRSMIKHGVTFNIIVALVNFVPAAFDRQKRTGQDFLCNTRVVCK